MANKKYKPFYDINVSLLNQIINIRTYYIRLTPKAPLFIVVMFARSKLRIPLEKWPH